MFAQTLDFSSADAPLCQRCVRAVPPERDLEHQAATLRNPEEKLAKPLTFHPNMHDGIMCGQPA